MKKLFVLFLVVSALAVLALPVVAAHTTGHGEQPEAQRALPLTTNLPGSGAQLLSVIDTVTNWFFAIFTVIAVIMIILAAFQFITGGGDAEKVSEARQKLIWAAVGIIVALASKGLVPVLRAILGASAT